MIRKRQLSTEYPHTYEYLCKCRELLKGRPYFEKSSKKWYELWNQRDSRNFECKKKIITAEINRGNNFYLDTEGTYGNTKIYSIILNNDEDDAYYFVLGLLNSTVLEYVYKKISVPKAGGFYAYKTQFLEQLPIKKARDTSGKYQEIVTLTKRLCTEYDNVIEKRLNEVVCDLYNLTEEERRIINGETI